MARSSTSRGLSSGGNQKNPWARLTWDDLNRWAGAQSVSRGRGYQQQVSGLAASADGQLLAWVQGTHRYATTVELLRKRKGGVGLRSQCTCPVGVSCKHAVAVVLVYLDALRQGTSVPLAEETDRRWQLLEDTADFEEADEEDEFDEEEWEDEELDEPASTRRRRRGASKQPSRAEDLRAFLKAKPAAELLELVVSLAERYPEVGEELKEQQVVKEGRSDELVRRARQEIDELTSEPAWENHWTGEGELPDYRGLRRRFEQLLASGQADALVELGKRLLERGSTQVEESHDEGETATAIAACLEIVFRAVPQSSLSDPQKMLYAIDAELEDDYDLAHGTDQVLDRDWPAEAWSAVADKLKRRLEPVTSSQPHEDFSRRHRRDRLTDWIMHALDQAGRRDEALALCEAEAQANGSYERLVRWLMAEGRLDEASRWAREGIAKTPSQWAGITRNLKELLRDIAQARKDWPLVAAHHAEDFFTNPSVAGLQTLLKAAARAKCAEAVRAAALRFLETGRRPVTAGAGGKRRTRDAWPLPALELPAPPPSGQRFPQPPEKPRPHFEVLLELAIAEKLPDDVLHWYERWQSSQSRTQGVWGSPATYAERVADAVAATHPEQALAIHRQLAEAQIAATSPSAYEVAARHLRKVRTLLQQLGRSAEWPKLLATIREQNHRKRRLLEILDGLAGRAILDR